MSAVSETALFEGMPFDPTAPLTPSGNLRRRAAVSRLVQISATAAAVFAVAVLVIVCYGVASRGASALSFGFVIHNPSGLAGGGIFNSLLGTLEIVAFGALIALPIGILTGLYLTEFAGPRSRTASALRLALDVMAGLPTIIVGLFVYGLIVIPQHRQSGFAGGIALAIVMLPLMARSSQEVLLLVPASLREAADALGVNRWRAVVSVILPAAFGGILTGSDPRDGPSGGRNRAAADLRLDRIQPVRHIAEPVSRRPERVDVHLHVVRPASGPGRHPRVGSGVRADALDSHRQRPGSADPRPEPCQDGPMTDWDRTASQIRRAEEARRRIRIRTEPVLPVITAEPPASGSTAPGEHAVVFDIRNMSVYYGNSRALAGASLKIYRNQVTAVIGPSGCGKSTFIRSLNRMNDSIPGFRIEGQVLYHGHDLYGSRANRVEVRRRIGMVFQKPNPFPKSIYDNVAWAPRNLGMKGRLDDRVEQALRQAALWEEVKDRLKDSALGLSGGQQQRLCIARAIAIEPDVLLLDEPASALDPVATASIEDLMHNLKHRFTIVIVTHNMQQAARVADRTAFFSLDTTGPARVGTLIEYGDTETIFRGASDPRTRDYVAGKFG